MISLFALLTGCSILVLWLPFNYHPSHAGTIVFGLVYGFFSGSVVSLMMACVAKTGPLQTLGQRFGTFQIVISVSYVHNPSHPGVDVPSDDAFVS